MKNHYHKLIAAVIVLAMFSACKHKPTFQQLIIGSWSYSKTVITRPFPKSNILVLAYPGPNIGFNFINDSICDNKQGYLKTIAGSDPEHEKSIFLGNRTKYLLEKNSLKIWNPESSAWDEFAISTLTIDTLTFVANDNIVVKFAKIHYPVVTGNLYDRVIVSSSGCYGSCPINNVSIQSSGQVIYEGGLFNTANGFFTATISKTGFNAIEQQFGKAGFLTLQNNYQERVTDENTITLTFIKNGKIIKQIRDYAAKSPADLQFAYTPVIYLYQRLKLTPVPANALPPIYYALDFKNHEGKTCRLDQSEAFYLWSILKDSPLTHQPFTPKYTASFYDSLIEKIETDGRIFKYTTQNGKTKAYDLGYNYFERNALTDKFKNKDE